MVLNLVKRGCRVTFVKCLAGIVSLIFLPKTLTLHDIAFSASNSLNLPKLVVNELKQTTL